MTNSYENGKKAGRTYIYYVKMDLTPQEIAEKLSISLGDVQAIIEAPSFSERLVFPDDNGEIADDFERGRADGMIYACYVDMGINNGMRIATVIIEDVSYVKREMDAIYGEWIRERNN